jgi:hypothetical protein
MEIRNSSNPNFESNLRPEISIVQAKQQTEIIQEKRDEVDLDSESKESHYGLEVDKVGRLNKQITTPVKREVLRPRRKYKKRMNVIDRGGYTLADFKKEWSIHPEWHGLSTGQINLIDRGQPFTTAIRKFAKKESKGNGDEYEKIMGEFFDGFKKYKERISRKDYNFNDFKEEWSRHPEWSHSLIDERQLKYRNSFYVALKIYIKKQTNGDEEESARMMKEFFPEYRERVDRNNYTLEDYKKEWEEHPEWHGLSTKQIQSTNGLNFYRTFKNFAIKNTIEAWINRDREDWKIGGDTYNSEMELRKIYPDMSKPAYELNIQYKKEISQKYNTVTYLITKYEFTGGAHGNTSIATFTFNKDKQIQIEDILNFQNKNDIFLTKILKTHLISSIGKENLQEDMMDNGLGLAFLDKKDNFIQAKCNCDGFLYPSNFQNFVVLDEGIKFIMNTYQVGAGALGNPEAIIPWSELKPYLNSNFILK